MTQSSVVGRQSSVIVRLARTLVVLVATTVTGCASGGSGGGADGPGAPRGSSAAVAVAAAAPTRDYFVYVVSEATDEAALVRFGPDGARVERRMPVGIHPADPDGPHGAAVSPDGEHYFVTTGHGVPYGYIWKYETADDDVLGHAQLGMFPASMQITPDGRYAYVVNFNLYGEMVPSSVSIVDADAMVEVARLETCVMPHGSRFDPIGARHYSTCMMDDMLVEIDTRAFEVARHFVLTRGAERGVQGSPAEHRLHATQAGDPTGHGAHAAPPASTRCSPTWATTSADGSRVYVACNAANDIVEIDVASWRMLRRIPAGEGVYNLDVTRDGELLIATNKRGRSVSLFDVGSGSEIARIETTRPVVHGIAVSDDDRYAFISIEGIGSMPGTVEVIDLAARARVAAVDVGQMAGGIAFWRSAPAE
ncbi:MAG TPA: YncE family protein [Longimicrobiales bacterium]